MRAMRVDFVKSKGQPVLGWLVLVFGMALLGFMANRYVHMHQRQVLREQTRQEHARKLANLERERLAQTPAAQPNYAQDKRWRKASSELTLPWIDTLRAIEHATKPPVFLLTLKSDPTSGRLQMDAEASDFEEVLGYVSALQDESALVDTQLIAHEDTNDAQGHPLVRFSVQSKWVP